MKADNSAMKHLNDLKHLALIMDGNGRWAEEHGLKRNKGHEEGAERVRDLTTSCSLHPTIETLTLYAFSTENWKRPKLEVEFLMKLLDRYLNKEIPVYMENNVRMETIGDIERFSPKLQKTIAKVKEVTKDNTALTQVLALNYGSRDEIVRAVNRVIDAGDAVTEESLGAALDTPFTDVDLLIRTSGEQRLSNYLLWQLSYSEFFFTDTHWPDFKPDELEEIISHYGVRERKFGGI
jgi:undecaprenyl diphosphate synthase